MLTFRLILGISMGCFATGALSNITGSDLQNFNATTNGLDFVTVQSSETLGTGIFNLGLFSNYAVNTLPRYADSAGRQAKIGDSIVAADFNFGVGVASFWDIGLSIPSVIYQKVNFDGSRGEFNKNGITEVRANSKWRLLGGNDGGVAFVLSTNINLTANNPYVGAGAKPTVNSELVFDTSIKSLALGANIGYRKRSVGTPIEGFPIEPLKDQYLASFAASYLFTSIDTKLILEAYSAFPAKKTTTVKSRSASSAETLLGLKHDLTDQLALHGGIGTELGNGTASADWRIYTGLNYAFGFVDEKKQTALVSVTPKPKKTANKIPALIPKFVENPEPGPAEAPGEGDEVFVLHGINFAFDSASKVLPGTKEILKSLGDHLKKVGYEKVIIEGHTDSVGPEAYNLGLAQQRSDIIRDYLVKIQSMSGQQIEARSYGETRPIADNGNFQGRQLNRRVVFRIIYKK